jgi:hypothetical protein
MTVMATGWLSVLGAPLCSKACLDTAQQVRKYKTGPWGRILPLEIVKLSHIGDCRPPSSFVSLTSSEVIPLMMGITFPMPL